MHTTTIRGLLAGTLLAVGAGSAQVDGVGAVPLQGTAPPPAADGGAWAGALEGPRSAACLAILRAMGREENAARAECAAR